ncbi:hypothetical protein [Cryptosporangium phraense]|uniref:Uncharacterized protein n=1 Tax=Cryptosporangium phraense TaxID=2593070 RepID=A0A545AMW6_9ACTN|nr:hypothetical protein FL583_23610 [Cryptosporangium phraense]
MPTGILEDDLGPLLTLALVRKRRLVQVAIDLALDDVAPGLVRDHPIRPGAWPARPEPCDPDAVGQRQQRGAFAGLARGEQATHRQAAAVDGEVNRGARAPAGPPGPSPSTLKASTSIPRPALRAQPPFRAPAAC